MGWEIALIAFAARCLRPLYGPGDAGLVEVNLVVRTNKGRIAVPSTELPSSAGVEAAQAGVRATDAAAASVDERLQQLSALLDYFEPASGQSAAADADATETDKYENRIAQVRLGMAASLFTALRCKNTATAAHSVRVALGCSAWALAMEFPDSQRDAIEVAALLHDIGKIGIADRLLLKPGALTLEEQALMDRHRAMGLEILQSCCASPSVLEIVRQAPTWFDGTKFKQDCAGLQLSVGARMLAIVDAYDSMTTPQVYRAAISPDRAIKELCDFAGRQFDPQLVVLFAELQSSDQHKLHHRVARRWLQELDPQVANNWWQHQAPAGGNRRLTPDWLHQQRLLENMYEGVFFLDANLQVLLWNRGAERLTGINGQSMIQHHFVPSLVNMRNAHGAEISDGECPVAQAVHSGVQSLRRLVIRSRNGQDLAVNLHTIPVVGPDGATQGASVLLHDVSGEASLEERCHSLYEQAIRDPLTQLANRAEFDRVHAMFVDAHLERRLPCSLIICDIDRFKQVNDKFGHLAGDEVIKSFSQILKSGCRPGDLVARFGGEEFVMLCADCNNATAAARAEQLRKAFSDLPQAVLGGKPCSASFGVTEIQPGDNSQTMLNRADRGLLMAKESGRNLVVQLGSGMSNLPLERRRKSWFWQRGTRWSAFGSSFGDKRAARYYRGKTPRLRHRSSGGNQFDRRRAHRNSIEPGQVLAHSSTIGSRSAAGNRIAIQM